MKLHEIVLNQTLNLFSEFFFSISDKVQMLNINRVMPRKVINLYRLSVGALEIIVLRTIHFSFLKFTLIPVIERFVVCALPRAGQGSGLD